MGGNEFSPPSATKTPFAAGAKGVEVGDYQGVGFVLLNSSLILDGLRRYPAFLDLEFFFNQNELPLWIYQVAGKTIALVVFGKNGASLFRRQLGRAAGGPRSQKIFRSNQYYSS